MSHLLRVRADQTGDAIGLLAKNGIELLAYTQALGGEGERCEHVGTMMEGECGCLTNLGTPSQEAAARERAAIEKLKMAVLYRMMWPILDDEQARDDIAGQAARIAYDATLSPQPPTAHGEGSARAFIEKLHDEYRLATSLDEWLQHAAPSVPARLADFIAAPATHTVERHKIEVSTSNDNDGMTFRVTCSCGWSSAGHLSGSDAEEAGERHRERQALRIGRAALAEHPTGEEEPLSRTLDLWLCPICGDAWTVHGEDAHCAGSATEGSAHESVACVRVVAALFDHTAEHQESSDG